MTPHSPTGDPASPGVAPVLTQCSPCPTQPPVSPGGIPVLTRCDLCPTQDDCTQEVAPFLTRQSTVSTPASTSGASGPFQSCPCPTQAPASPGGAQKLTQSDLCPTQQDDEWALIDDFISQDLQTWDNWVQEMAPFCAGQSPLLQQDYCTQPAAPVIRPHPQTESPALTSGATENFHSLLLQSMPNAGSCPTQSPALTSGATENFHSLLLQSMPNAGSCPTQSPAPTSGATENIHSPLLQSMLTAGPCPTQQQDYCTQPAAPVVRPHPEVTESPAPTSGATENIHSLLLQSMLTTGSCPTQSPALTRGAPVHTHSATLQSMLTTDQNMAQHECKDYKNVLKKKHKPVIQKIDDKTSFYYECPFCIKNFSKLNLLEHHIKFKHNEKPEFPCSECDKKFSRASCRNRHERSCSLLKEKRAQGYTCNEPEAMDVDVVTHGVGAQAQPAVEEAEQPSNLDNECVGASATLQTLSAPCVEQGCQTGVHFKSC